MALPYVYILPLLRVVSPLSLFDVGFLSFSLIFVSSLVYFLVDRLRRVF